MKRRAYLASVATVSVAGCGGVLDGGESETYNGEAEPLLLDVNEMPTDGWDIHQERGPNFEPPSMDDAHVIDFINKDIEKMVTIGVLVFDTAGNAAEFHDEQRAKLETKTDFTDESYGDKSHSASKFGLPFVETLESNVWIQVYGRASLEAYPVTVNAGMEAQTVNAVMEAQVERIQSADGWTTAP